MVDVNTEKHFDKLYSEEQLTKKLSELKRLRDEDSDEENNINSKVSQEDNVPILQRSHNPPLHRINVQDYDKNIESDEEAEEADIGEKAEAVSDLLFNSLITEVLKDMAQHPNTIIPQFKQYAVKKPKIKRAPPKPKKYGFPTNQAEIKRFIE